MKKIFLALSIIFSSSAIAQVVDTGEIPFDSSQGYTGNAGINTDQPAASLHVNGNQILGRALPARSDRQYSPLVRDTNTGEIRIQNVDETIPKPFNFVTYTINQPNGDWIRNLNLNIPSDRYHVSVNGSQFLNRQSRTGDVGFLYVARVSAMQQTFTNSSGNNIIIDDPTDNDTEFDVLASKNVTTFVQNGTWRLRADYAGAGPLNKVDGIWVVEVIVIDKSYTKSLNSINVNLNGNSSGTAPYPSGLN